MFNKFFSESLAFYEIMWNYSVEPKKPQITVQYGAGNMRLFCRITKAKMQTRTQNI